tara:strand:+ start:61 stop:309 length:249 start_codon:yes stop_codon:yes gene_type:complete
MATLIYKDKTFCKSDCLNDTCHKFISREITRDSEEQRLPLATSDFSDYCQNYHSYSKDEEILRLKAEVENLTDLINYLGASK